MQVMKVTSPTDDSKTPAVKYMEENLIGDLNYYRAEKLTKKLLEKGLITERQYGLLMDENKRTFRPFLAEIM
jgi:hypothetical protein